MKKGTFKASNIGFSEEDYKQAMAGHEPTFHIVTIQAVADVVGRAREKGLDIKIAELVPVITDWLQKNDRATYTQFVKTFRGNHFIDVVLKHRDSEKKKQIAEKGKETKLRNQKARGQNAIEPSEVRTDGK